MSRKIEDAFDDCFERLLSGESLESCINSYPEHAAELDNMLRMAFDVRRRAFPIQPSPQFRYWSRVNLQTAQYYASQQSAPVKSSVSNLRRNLAFSLAALLVFVMASSGTAAASSDALPDQPLYGVKLAVEQVQLTLTPSDTAKAELYASLAEKRAQEIAVMASQGKNDKVVSTTTRMYYQLEQAETLITKSEIQSTGWNTNDNGGITGATETTMPATSSSANAPTTDSSSTGTSSAVMPSGKIVEPTTKLPSYVSPSNQQQIVSQNQTTAKSFSTPRNVVNINKARTAISNSNAKSLVILQNALDKAPASVKSNLNQVIERTRETNERINSLPVFDHTPKPIIPGTRLDDGNKQSPFNPPVKKRNIPSMDSSTDKDDQSSDNGQLDTTYNNQATFNLGSTGTNTSGSDNATDAKVDNSSSTNTAGTTGTAVTNTTVNTSTPVVNKVITNPTSVRDTVINKTIITR